MAKARLLVEVEAIDIPRLKDRIKLLSGIQKVRTIKDKPKETVQQGQMQQEMEQEKPTEQEPKRREREMDIDDVSYYDFAVKCKLARRSDIAELLEGVDGIEVVPLS